MDSINELPKDIKFLCEWIEDFDKLLNDKIGVKLFSEFLKKEYSNENLKFWLCCRKYKKISDLQQQTKYAKHIYDKYLSAGASDAVNVDERARLAVESALTHPTAHLFAVPQQQIYDLMKFDCYKRFLKSLYSNNFSENAFHENIIKKFNTNDKIDTKNDIIVTQYRRNAFKKLKKLELSEINRRINKRKLLKTLSPKKRLINTSINNKNLLDLKPKELHPIKCGRLERSTKMQSIQWIQSNILTPKQKLNNSSLSETTEIKCLKVLFSDRSHERLVINTSQTIEQTVDKLLKKRNLNFTSFEVFPISSDKALDLTSDVMKLSADEIRVEQRVTFEVQLPNGLVVSVKSKPSTMSAKVLNPILTQFNAKYDPEYYVIKFVDTKDSLAPDLPIFCADNRKLMVVYNGINENKSFVSDMSRNTVIDKEFLSEFLAKENNFLKKPNKNKKFLNISDISFNDDNKSEEFFDDLLKSSQTIPKQSTELTLSPQFNIAKIGEYSRHLNNSYENNANENEENIKKLRNSKKIISPKLKLIEFKKKSPLALKSDQLYDKKFVQRNDKNLSSNDKKYKKSKSNESLKQNSTEKVATNSMQTLSKFHKTSNEKLSTKPKSEVISKIVIPNIFLNST